MAELEQYDVIVIGAGMGGLVAACQLGQAGKRVLLVENLSFIGGRFSGFKVEGAEIPSGAFHTFPHGNAGPFAQALRRCGVQIEVPTPQIFASFHVDGRHLLAKSGFGVLGVMPTWAEKLALIRILFHSWAKLHGEGSFGDWLVKIGLSERGLLLYERFCQFALSASVFDVPYPEGRKVTEMILKFGVPGVPMGGARQVAKQLGAEAEKNGVTLRKNTQAEGLLIENGRVCGAVLFDRRKGARYCAKAVTVISNMGPAQSFQMAQAGGLEGGSLIPAPQPAIGLKLQVLSPKSLIDHDSIMFCLDTKRIAGILQASNVDPRLAPEGKHLLISHQIIAPNADWQAERELALEDWRYLFGADFENCEVLGTGHFPAAFPVNWAVQGHDLRQQPFADKGLWMVGDGLKPQGLMMVEGAAASAEQVVAQILGRRNQTPWELSHLQLWPRRALKQMSRLLKRGGQT